MKKIQEKPEISKKSKFLMMNSTRSSLPMHSPLRYKIELEHERYKRQVLEERRQYEAIAKQMMEDEDIERNRISDPLARLNVHKFNQKYDLWISKQEENKNSKSPQDAGGRQSPSFRPQILPRSRQLASNVEPLLDRMGGISESRVKKIEHFKSSQLPSFTPVINKNSERIVDENNGLPHYRIANSFQMNKSVSSKNQNTSITNDISMTT